MAANEEIMQAIEIIDKRIRTLMHLKQGLIDEFQIGQTEKALPLPFKGLTRGSPVKNKPTNRERIIQFLREQGPQSRKEIVEKTAIPVGSVAGVLTEKEIFYTKDEKWHLVEYKES